MQSNTAHLVNGGGAGFIAHTLICRRLRRGDQVVAVDNLSRGARASLNPCLDDPCFAFREANCAELASFRAAVAENARLAQISHVWRLAANADLPAGVEDPTIDLRDTFQTTFNTLQVMRDIGASELHFAPSSTIYGDLGAVAVEEDCGPLEPISN